VQSSADRLIASASCPCRMGRDRGESSRQGVESLPLDGLPVGRGAGAEQPLGEVVGNTPVDVQRATAAYPDRVVRRTTGTAGPARTAWINRPQPQTANALITHRQDAT
jgi:hypothetical protein